MEQIGLETLNLFREVIYNRTGIHLPDEKDYLLRNKLNNLLYNNICDDLISFYNLLTKGDERAIEHLAKSITTNHTFFFREREHFDILVNLIKMSSKVASDYKVIWCAASSSGEEAYSIIITLLEANLTNFMVVASDINKDVLHHMKEGIYHRDRLKFIDKYYLTKYFTRIDEKHYRVSPTLKRFLIIKNINLIDNFYFESKVDYIFCRNVMIYFDLEIRKLVLRNLLNNLKDSGYIFIGHSETFYGLSEEVESVFTAVYNKRLS